MSMFDVSRVSVDVGDGQISFETGKLARQASGAVVVQSGDTMVLCTATMGNLRDVDFLPLTVDVEERMYAAGKIPGSFFRREGRSGEKATLTARMIDRPIRPLFPKGWHFETQLVATPLSVDHVHPYDILAMNGASAALAISPVPVAAHVGAVRVGKLDGDFVVNPPEESLEELELDLIVAGTDEAILMVEAGADGVTEAEILDALDIAHSEIKKLCASMQELADKAGKEKLEVEAPKIDEGLLEEIRSSHGQALVDAIATEGKLERYEAIGKVKDEVVEKYAPAGDDGEVDSDRKSEVGAAFDAIEKDTIRKAGHGGQHLRRPLPVALAPPVHDEGEERPGGPRGHPARRRPCARPEQVSGRAPRPRAEPVPADLAAHAGVADGRRRRHDRQRPLRRRGRDADGDDPSTDCELRRERHDHHLPRLPPGLRRVVRRPAEGDAEREALLPALTVGQSVPVESLTPNGHTTSPPARYTEA